MNERPYNLQEMEDIKIVQGIMIAIVVFILFLFIGSRKKKRRHIRNIGTGERIIQKLNSFEHDGAKMNYLRKIDPFVFEELVLSAFEKKGFRIKRNKKYTGDGGIDGTIFTQANEKILIQCKRYKSYVNKKDIYDFHNLLSQKNIKGGYFCHTGKTGKTSLAHFSDSRLRIISGNKLIELISLEKDGKKKKGT